MKRWIVILWLLVGVAGLSSAWVLFAARQLQPGSAEPLSVNADRSSPSSVFTAPPTHVDTAPRIGLITIGAFAPESMPNVDLSLEALDSDTVYGDYRAAVRANYGADLADMNYLGVGLPHWRERYVALSDWIMRSSVYGDPTIAVEPVGRTAFSIFTDSAEMRDLRSVFTSAGSHGITIWVRFASESNLRYSVYTVYNDPIKIAEYRRSVRWFRHYMPANVKLVFSPLINTAYLQDPRQIHTLIRMYEPKAYDRIGGTLYATSWCRPKVAFNWYYHFMHRLDPSTPFQICELGGTFPRADEIRAFLLRAARGDWPGVERINLFAGDLNPLAVNQHGHFGFILPSQSSSYLCDLLSSRPTGAALAAISTDAELDRLEELSAGWQSLPMTLEGELSNRISGSEDFLMNVEYVTDELGDRVQLSPSRKKRIVPLDDCVGAHIGDDALLGTYLVAVGWDSGAGTPLRASSIAQEADPGSVGG